MRRLLEAIRQKRTELWKNQSWILHHDNATAHISILVREFRGKNKTVNHASTTHRIHRTWPPLVFFLFPKLQTPIKEKHFAMIEEIKEVFRGLEKTLA